MNTLKLPIPNYYFYISSPFPPNIVILGGMNQPQAQFPQQIDTNLVRQAMNILQMAQQFGINMNQSQLTSNQPMGGIQNQIPSQPIQHIPNPIMNFNINQPSNIPPQNYNPNFENLQPQNNTQPILGPQFQGKI